MTDDLAAAAAARLAKTRERIADACVRAGRSDTDVVLLGASKRQSVEVMRATWEAGLEVFGENRVQEALAKSAEMPDGVEWHLIGPLQSNKAKPAARLFRAVHSVDRPKIARALDREAGKLARVLDGFLEVNLGGEDTKHGFPVGDFVDRVDELASLEHLRLVGLMAIPPFEADVENARRWFQQLRELRDELFSRPAWSDRPGYLSMGMSHDFEIAVEEGATHVRVGTALFGPRPE